MTKRTLGVALLVLVLVTLSVGAVPRAVYADATCYTGCTTQTSASTSPSVSVPSVQPKAAANSGGLALTGADIEGITIIGAGACLVGALVLHRSRRRHRTPTSPPTGLHTADKKS